jgi:hypothetical protein
MLTVAQNAIMLSVVAPLLYRVRHKFLLVQNDMIILRIIIELSSLHRIHQISYILG